MNGQFLNVVIILWLYQNFLDEYSHTSPQDLSQYSGQLDEQTGYIIFINIQ